MMFRALVALAIAGALSAPAAAQPCTPMPSCALPPVSVGTPPAGDNSNLAATTGWVTEYFQQLGQNVLPNTVTPDQLPAGVALSLSDKIPVIQSAAPTAFGTVTLSQLVALAAANINPPSLTVSPPAPAVAGNAVQITGTYAGAAPAPAYSLDGGAWTAGGSPTAASGQYSFSISGVAAGTHTLVVRDANNPSTVFAAAPAPVIVAPAAEIVVDTPPTVLQSQGVPVIGYATPGLPTPFKYTFDCTSSCTFTTLPASVVNGQFNATVPAPALGGHYMLVEAADGSVVSATTGTFQVTSPPALAAGSVSSVAQNAAVSIPLTVTYDSAPSGIQYFLNGGWWPVPGVTFSGSGTTWTATITIAGLPVNVYGLPLRLTDSPGAIAYAGPFFVGTAAGFPAFPNSLPAGTIASYAGEANYTTTGSTHIWCSWNDKSTDQILCDSEPSAHASVPWSFTSSQLQVPAVAGTQTLSIFNNGGGTQLGSITFTTTPCTSPSISVDYFAGNFSVSQPTTLTGEYCGGVPTGLVYCLDSCTTSSGTYANTGPVVPTTPSPNNDGHFTVVIPPLAGVTQGSHKLYLAAAGYPGSLSAAVNSNSVQVGP